MASESTNKPCVKCLKRPAQVVCTGCEQSFCVQHLAEHRQDLTQLMDNLIVDHDQLQQKLMNHETESDQHVLMARIDRWESRSIQKIRETAKNVRSQLGKLLFQTKTEIQTSLDSITQEMKCSRQMDAYTEIDLNQWMKQLSRLKKELDETSTIELIHDEDDGSSGNIPLLQLCSGRQVRVSADTHETTRWLTKGQTMAGGYGKGDALNQLFYPYGFDIDDDGTLFIADHTNHRIMRWRPNTCEGEIVFGGNEAGTGLNQLNQPIAVVIDRINRSLIVSDSGNRRIVRWSLEKDEQDDSVSEVIISNIYALGLAIDNDGCLYVSNYQKHEVYRYELKDGNQRVLIAGGNGKGSMLHQLHHPRNVFVDRDHSVYISDMWNHRVVKWTRGASQGVVVAGGRNPGNSLGQLWCPSGISVDCMGTVYVADQANHRVMRWLKNARKGDLIVGEMGQGSNSDQLNQPASITFDSQGNLYVADYYNDRIQRFHIQLSERVLNKTKQSNIDRIIQWKPNATHGEVIAGGEGAGNLTDHDFENQRVIRWSLDEQNPNRTEREIIISNTCSFGLAIDSEGSLYVSDCINHGVRRYEPKDGRDGVVVAGAGGRGAALGQLNFPRYNFVDADHSVYVLDTMNHRVIQSMRNAQEGVIVAGGQGQGDGLGKFNYLSGPFVDRMGSVYATDFRNNRLMHWSNGGNEGEMIVGGNVKHSNGDQFNQATSISFDSANDRSRRFDIQYIFEAYKKVIMAIGSVKKMPSNPYRKERI